MSDCEELSGSYSQGMMGVGFSVGLWFYSSVPQSYFDIFSYHILFSSLFSFPSVPQSNFDEISYYILFFSPSVHQS